MTTFGVVDDRPLSAGHRVRSEVHLESTNGLFVGRTRTWSTVLWSGIHSAGQAVVLDGAGEVIVRGPLNVYDVDSTLLGHHERVDIWAWHIPPPVRAVARQIAVIHTWNPRWLAEVAPSLTSIDAILHVLEEAGIGSVAIGGEMSWPNELTPWSRWQDGLAGEHDADAASERGSRRSMAEV
jgi:hypothetical protein